MNQSIEMREDELDVLFPEKYLTVGGTNLKMVHVPVEQRELTIKEFSFGQSLRLEPVVSPLVEAMSDAITDEDRLDWQKIMGTAGKHPEIVGQLLAESTGEDREYIEALDDRSGRMLVLAFFKVNWDFFIDRLVAHKMTTASQAETATQE